MKHLNLSLMLATSALSLLAVACGGDDDSAKSNADTGAGPNSGVASDRLMSSLSDAEVAQINKATGEYTTAQMSAHLTTQQLCDYVGVMVSAMAVFGDEEVTDASLRQSCTSMAQRCTQNPSTATESASEETAPDELATADLADCHATVAEYELCVKDSMAVGVAMMKSFPKCADLTVDSISTTATPAEPANPTSCQTLSQKCPGYDDASDISDASATELSE